MLCENADERERRWGKINAERVREYAERGRLLLARDWTADLVLEPNGEVTVVDTEYGKGDSQASNREARGAFFRSIEVMPELLSFLPHRPAEAIQCEICAGTGVLEMALTNRTLRNVICQCSGAGWILPSEVAIV